MYFLLFQDLNLTWNSDVPDFTVCFQRSAVVWLPCFFLWATMPIYGVYLSRCKKDIIPANWLNTSKTVKYFFLFASHQTRCLKNFLLPSWFSGSFWCFGSPGRIWIIICRLFCGSLLHPRFNEVERGVYWFHLVHPSVYPSVDGTMYVRSVSSTVFNGSISYLHLL